MKKNEFIEKILQVIQNERSITKLSEISVFLNPENLINFYYTNLMEGKSKLYNHIHNLLLRSEKIYETRGLTKKDYIELIIAIIYHDFTKVIDENFLNSNSDLRKILRLDLGHSNSVRRLFFYVDEPRIAHHMRHNSTDFVVDIALRSVTVPQLALNLLDKTDDLGSYVDIWSKYEIIKNKIGKHPDYDDDSEIICCKYLDRVNKEKQNFYDYEFITMDQIPHLSSLIVQRFDGKYCAPVGKYSDTSSNLKISKNSSFWGYKTTIIHEGDFRLEDDNSKTILMGCDPDSVDTMLPIFCDKNDVVIIEGSTSRLKAVKNIISPSTGLVLLLRTLANGFSKERALNAVNADEIWVMTEDMKEILENTFNNLDIKYPEIKILQSGFDEDKFFIDPSILRVVGKIVYIGAITDIKGVDVLVEAFKEVVVDFPYAELHLVGDPEIYGRVNFFDLNLLNHPSIFYHGAKNANFISKILKEAHFSVLLTKIYETFGKAALQARCCGTKMIVSSKGALKYHIENENEGIVLAEINKETVKTALRQMLSEEPKTVPPAKNKYHSWKITALDYAIYISLLKRKSFRRVIEMMKLKKEDIFK